jgi:hypothetical protein
VSKNKFHFNKNQQLDSDSTSQEENNELKENITQDSTDSNTESVSLQSTSQVSEVTTTPTSEEKKEKVNQTEKGFKQCIK